MNTVKRSLRFCLSLGLVLGQSYAALFSLSPVLTARAAALTVTSASDSGGGSLRQALATAQPGDTITFNLPPDTTITVNEPLTVTQPITIEGSSAINLNVSGGGSTRVFDMSAPATLSGFTVLNGNAFGSPGGHGGGLFSTVEVTLTSMNFVSNTAVSGGGVYADGQLIIDATRFEGNTALVYGGAVSARNTSLVKSARFLGNVAQAGGAIYHSDGVVLINNALFARNVATSTAGAGLFIEAPADALGAWVVQSTFANPEQSPSSAIHVLGGGALVINSIVASYSVGIVSEGAMVLEGYNLFSGNGENLSTSACGFVLNSAGLAGLMASAPPVAPVGMPSKQDVICLQPPAPDAAGKVSAQSSNAADDVDTLLARMSRLSPDKRITAVRAREGMDTLRNAYAARLAAAVPARAAVAPAPAPGPAQIHGVPMTGTIYSIGTSLTLDPDFVDPAVDNYHLTAASPAINIGAPFGGDPDDPNNFYSRDIDGEPRPQSGGYDAGFDEVALPARCYATPDDGATVFESYTASAVQNAVDTNPVTGTVKVAGYCAAVQARNYTTQTLYVAQPMTIRGGYTSTNWLLSDPTANPTVLDAYHFGRVVYITGTHGTLENMTVQHGASMEANGAGIFAGGSLTLTGMTVSSNNTELEFRLDWEKGGGGAYVAGDLSLSNTTFISNAAIIGGGALVTGSLQAVSSTFRDNIAFVGGGLAVSEKVVLSSSLFERNYAFGGGGLFGGAWFLSIGFTDTLDSIIRIADTRFVDNVGYELGGGLWSIGPTVLTNTSFTGNVGSIGGGIGALGPLMVTRGLFENNWSEGGAGLYLTGPAVISNSRFISNSAAAGAGVYAEASPSVSMANVLFARNDASDAGSAIYLDDSDDVRVLHTTIASPTQSAVSAIQIMSGTLGITNSIIASHTVGISAEAGEVIEDANVFFGNGANLSGTVTATIASGGHSVMGDPSFVDTTTDNYRLNEGSPAIDLGADAGVYTDIDDEPRPQRLGFDAGYSEWHYETITGLQALSDSPTAIGQVTAFSATIATGSQVTYTWDFGDGSMGNGATASHIYAQPGAYTATVTATNLLTTVRASVAVNIIPNLLLPMVFNDFSRGPDLVVLTMTVSPQSGLDTSTPVVIAVTVKNQGVVPVSGFWVDLYLNPRATPATNATWPLLCATPWPSADCYGGAWYVTQTVQPGQTIILSSSDLSADANYSHWLSRIPVAGTHSLYAYVDAYAEAGEHGLIHELNEGNNLLGPITVTVAPSARASRAASQTVSATRTLQPRGAVQSK